MSADQHAPNKNKQDKARFSSYSHFFDCPPYLHISTSFICDAIDLGDLNDFIKNQTTPSKQTQDINFSKRRPWEEHLL